MKQCLRISLPILALTLISAQLVRADLYPPNYLQSNTDPATLQINDRDGEKALYNLFNTYFGLTGDQAYTDSNQLYADRGVKETVLSWRVDENAKILSAFNSAAFSHDVFMIDANDPNRYSWIYNSDYYTYDTVFDTTMRDLGQLGDVNFLLINNYWSHWFEVESDSSLNPGGLVAMIALDVTDLMREKYSDLSISNAYLFGWEDAVGNNLLDFDYQDLAFMVVNVAPNTASTTPEPASALILGLGGLVGLPLARRFRTRRQRPTGSAE